MEILTAKQLETIIIFQMYKNNFKLDNELLEIRLKVYFIKANYGSVEQKLKELRIEATG